MQQFIVGLQSDQTSSKTSDGYDQLKNTLIVLEKEFR